MQTPPQISSVCAVKAQPAFSDASGDSPATGLRIKLWETQLPADIALLAAQSSCGNTANEVVTAPCSHHPVLLPWNGSLITLIRVSGVLQFFHQALIENLLLSDHRWLMASIVCGFTLT